MSDNKQTGRGMYGKGYYIALILCACAIGISGYLYYRNANDTQSVLEEPDRQMTVPVGALEDDFPVSSTVPGTESSTPPTGKGNTGKKQVLKTTAPVSGEMVAGYAMEALSYNETTRDWRVHNGIDIAAPEGTQVVAAADGEVYTIYEDDIMGTTVVIRHQDGYVTTYSSLAADLSVRVGDTVEMSQVIGTVGSTALIETAMGPHVHFSVKLNDEVMDPEEFLSMNS